MLTPPCSTCKSECCYNVPMHKVEIEKCFDYLCTLDGDYVSKLTKQKRPKGMCMFVDTEQWKCSVYPVRPHVCQIFGYTPQLPCSYAPQLASRIPADECHEKTQTYFDKLLWNMPKQKRNDLTINGKLFTWEDVTLQYGENK